MVAGVLHSVFSLGAINTTASKTVKQVFAGPRNIWARGNMNRVIIFDDPAEADVFVRQFKDAGGTQDVHFAGFFSSTCTEVTYKVFVDEAFCVANGITVFFG